MKFKRVISLLLAIMLMAFDLSAAMLTVDAASAIGYTPGDLNSDGMINTTDVVLLRRHIAGGYNVTINESAADVNTDGQLNTTDVVFIRRYVAGGYGVTLKPAPGTEPGCQHVEIIDPAVEATCTASGLTEGKHCSLCGEVLAVQQTVAALGHSFGEWLVTKEPTETVAGEKRRDCVNCEAFETAPVAALAHDHNRWNKITLEAVAPTCTATGLTEGSKCSGCGEILVAQQTVAALGHR